MPLRVTAEIDPLNEHLEGTSRFARDLQLAKERYREIYTGDHEDVYKLTYEEDRDNWCGARTDGQYGGEVSCSRPKGHPAWWNHVASSGHYVLRIWGAQPVPELDKLIDPEDGSPVDDPAVMDRAGILLGYCYKLRDRQNQLYVVGGVGDYVRTDGLIECIDLKRREFRAIPVEEFVPSNYVMTPQELSLVVAYIAKVRKTVKNEAVTMYRRDKWCRDGLNAALKDLGLAPYRPELTGTLQINVPWVAPEGTLNRHVRDKLLEAFKTIDLSSLNIEVSTSEYVEVDTERVTADVVNVGRR